MLDSGLDSPEPSPLSSPLAAIVVVACMWRPETTTTEFLEFLFLSFVPENNPADQ